MLTKHSFSHTRLKVALAPECIQNIEVQTRDLSSDATRRPCQGGGGGPRSLFFKMSRVGILSRLHNAVGNLATYIWLRQSFVAFSFELCRYFLAHVACRNLPWQGLYKTPSVPFDS